MDGQGFSREVAFSQSVINIGADQGNDIVLRGSSVADFHVDMELELEYIYNFTLELANGAAPSFFPDRTPAAPAVSAGAIPYYECDIQPTFLGSTDPKVFLEKWVYAYLKYPQEAVRNGVQGRVLVDFVIDEKGKMTDVKVLKGVDPLLDAEAVKVVSASPDWKPARLQGRKVRSEMSLYVEFKLEKRKNR